MLSYLVPRAVVLEHPLRRVLFDRCGVDSGGGHHGTEHSLSQSEGVPSAVFQLGDIGMGSGRFAKVPAPRRLPKHTRCGAGLVKGLGMSGKGHNQLQFSASCWPRR